MLRRSFFLSVPLLPPWRNSKGELCCCETRPATTCFATSKLRRVRPGWTVFKKKHTQKQNSTSTGGSGHNSLPHTPTASLSAPTVFIPGLPRRTPLKRAQLFPSWFHRNVVSLNRLKRSQPRFHPHERERNAWLRTKLKAAFGLEKLSVMRYWATSHGWSNAESLTRLPDRKQTRPIPRCSLNVAHKLCWRGTRAVLSFWWMNEASGREPIKASVNYVNISNMPSGHSFQNKRLPKQRALFLRKPGLWTI